MEVIGAVGAGKKVLDYANGGYWSSGSQKNAARLRQWRLLEQWGLEKRWSTTPMEDIGAVRAGKKVSDYANGGYWSSGSRKKGGRLRQWRILEQWELEKRWSTTPIEIYHYLSTIKFQKISSITIFHYEQYNQGWELRA
jgi:hypothetical protein